MSDIPLSIKSVSKNFQEKEVLDGISFDVKKREMFGLIGLNGVGKTTLIKIILGLLKQDSGKVEVFGKSPAETSSRKELSYLPEKFNPSLFLKGNEFLSLSLAYFGKKFDIDEASEIAESLGLDHKALNNRIGKYSKGMGQKLGLISALLTGAPLLILDEPMSGLDPRARIQLKDNLEKYKGRDKTIFFSSHILSDIDELCDRIAIIHDRKIIFAGKPEEFKKKYKAPNLERSFLKAIDLGTKKKAA